MFVILYYDVNSKRCGKMLKKCREYLQWVQNSVFEGEITQAKYEGLISDLNKVLKKDDGDSLVCYKFRAKKYTERSVYGNDKKDDIKFL
ncbi:MAG: CRISPR-associated endonuclease Cas2 [Candidatus Muiribacteriota bacterium]